MNDRIRRNKTKLRGGAVTVELAVMLPVILTLLFGVLEVSRGLEVAHVMSTAVREGARFGAMDKEGMLAENQTANQKVISDIRVFLIASGLPGDQATINITTVPDANTGSVGAFDLNDPVNDLLLFQIEATLPYAAVSYVPEAFLKNQNLTARIVFRNARSTLVN